MIASSRRTASRTGSLAAASAQAALGVGAHVAAAGCLPGGSTLVLAGPTAVVAVLLLGRALPRHRLLRLAGGQLAVHAVLAAVAACSGAHAHASSPAMLLGHVAALVLGRAVLDEVARCTETAAGTICALLRPALDLPVLHLPVAPAVAVAAPAPLWSYDLLLAAPRRGPPAGAPLPA